MVPKIGFACKYIETKDQVKGVKKNDSAKKFNTQSTTVAWLQRQSKSIAHDKLWDIVKANVMSTNELVRYVASLPEGLRMLRLSSDILPMYTHKDWSYFYLSWLRKPRDL